jgi:hypothetical protein
LKHIVFLEFDCFELEYPGIWLVQRDNYIIYNRPSRDGKATFYVRLGLKTNLHVVPKW